MAADADLPLVGVGLSLVSSRAVLEHRAVLVAVGAVLGELDRA